MENQQNYFFYGVSKLGRRVTIAGIVIADQPNTGITRLRIGISECSKKDQFVKSKGRLIAKGRALSNHPKLIAIVDSEQPAKQFVNIAKELAEPIKKNKSPLQIV